MNIFGEANLISQIELIMKRIYLLCFLSYSAFAQLNGSNPVRFAVLTDLHLVPGNENDQIFSEVVKAVESHKPSLIFVAGDLTNQGNNIELENVALRLKEFKIPVHVIPGNHETTWSESAGKKINELWSNDRFYIETADIRYCGISTGPYMRMSDGLVKSEDLRWLDKTLGTTANSKKPIVFFCHYPMQDGLGNFTSLTDVLNKYPVEIAFCGHEHRFKLYNSDSIPQVVCEALRSRTGNVGYTIVDLKPDTAYCNYYKLYDNVPDSIIKVDLINKHCLDGKLRSSRPEKTGGELPAGWKLEQIENEGASVFTGVAENNGRMIYGTSDGRVVCRKVDNGSLCWEKNVGHSLFSTPLIYKNDVIIGSSQNEILAFDIATGNLCWRTAVEAPVTCDGVLNGNDLFIGGGKGCFLKINAATGKVIWRFDGIRSNARLQGAPALNNDVVVFGAWDTYLYCLDRQTGILKWKWNNGKEADLLSPGNVVPVIADDRVLIVAPDRYLTILSLETGKTLYRTNQYKVRESLGYSAELKRAYAKTMDGEMVSFVFPADSLQDVKVTSMQIGYEHNPCLPLIAGGWTYSGSRKGEIVVTDAQTNEFLFRYKCGNSSVLKFQEDASGNVIANLAEGTIWKISH